MVSQEIQGLTEKLACDFMMANPEEPETLSGLLPVLKQIHDRCRQLKLKTEAESIQKARKMINALVSEPGEAETRMTALGDLITVLSFSLREVEEKEDAVEKTAPPSADPDPVRSDFDAVEAGIEQFSSLIASFCPGEIPDLGAMLNTLDVLLAVSENYDPSTFHEIAQACKTYVERMTLENISEIKPIEEGVILLKSILNHLKRKEPFAFDYSDVLDLLNASFETARTEKAVDPEEKEPEPVTPAELQPISADDMEILADFVAEAVENLDTIEIKLMDLEQDPSNKDIINDIFRPFHTIKGVSGFLSLTRINKLAHATENLLDSARSGEFIIDQQATDAILESVDTLKALIERVRQGLQTGFRQPDEDIDTENLRHKLQRIQAVMTQGEKEPLGQILIRKNAVDRETVEDALETQRACPDKRLGEILVEGGRVDPGQVVSALVEQNSARNKPESQVKVSTQKLDDLVDYAGELVIAQAMLRQQTAHDPALNQSVAHLGQIVTNMQNIAMSMRMIPIKATFMKMIRLVRDLSRKVGKDVNLSMSGEDTEIDRNVVDALYEPMVHMIRNSLDHGIEPSGERNAKGKALQGNIYLRAYHKGGHIIIEIEDDGKGLDKDRILKKAVSTGLITGHEQMTDARIYDLILEPGFSTAEKITDVSGRGVGMDVVKSGIEKFRGHLNIASQKDRGTKFTISLPLTLAIIDGMLIRVETEKYVIPTTAVQKAFKPGPNDYFTVEGKGEMVKDRGNLIPLIRLSEIFKSGKGKKSIQDCLVVVVESKDEKRALLIDELLGKDEYVIKSLGTGLETIKGIAGGAILSDGRVGLILDIHGIFSIAQEG
jgi:two-component system chemotaxis sensor kinase CheA